MCVYVCDNMDHHPLSSSYLCLLVASPPSFRPCEVGLLDQTPVAWHALEYLVPVSIGGLWMSWCRTPVVVSAYTHPTCALEGPLPSLLPSLGEMRSLGCVDACNPAIPPTVQTHRPSARNNNTDDRRGVVCRRVL